MTKQDKVDVRRLALGCVSRSTRGNIRGVIEFAGLYTPAAGIA